MPALESPAQPNSYPIEPPPLNAKRKRDDSTDNIDVSTTQTIDKDDRQISNNLPFDRQIDETILDICEALKKYDPTPSLLAQDISSKDERDPDEPASKKTKLSQPIERSSIIQKAQKRIYSSLDELVSDVERASAEASAKVKSSQDESNTPQWKYQPDPLEPVCLAADIKAFKKVFKNIVQQIRRQDESTAEVKKEAEATLVNGHVSATSNIDDGKDDDTGKAVLTLFGNAQGQHKQLFSSFQKPLPHQFWTGNRAHDTSPQAASEVHVPIRENGLPANLIVSTKLVPVDSDDAVPPPKRNLRFHDLFKPPSALPPLTPPKPTSTSSARRSSITWSTDPSVAEPIRKNDYTTESLPTGQWLGYDGVTSEQEPSTPEAKRRKRDRALSSGEASAEPPEQVKAALAQAKEDALFRRVYSTFAPSTDNSASLVPEQVKNDIWWNRVGQTYYDQALAIDPALDDENAIAIDDPDEPIVDDDFGDVVEKWDAVVKDNIDAQPPSGDADSSTSALNKISELLEALQSHQQVRLSQIGSGSRSTAGSSSSTQDPIPTQPTSEERSVYDELYLKIARLVSKLPPYALSKLSGDPLGDLTLSRTILLEGKNYQGTMDDDQATRRSNAAALSASLASARNNTTNRSSQLPHTRTSSGQLPASTPTNASRQASASKPLGNWQTPAASYTSTTPRPTYQPPSTYGRTPLNQYMNGRPITANQVNGIGTGYSANTSQASYQQRAHNVGGQYGGYNNTPTGSRNPAQYTPGYPTLISRPTSSNYMTPTAGAGALQSPAASNRVPPRPLTGTAGSSLQQGSPYQPPTVNMVSNASNSASRPETPATPTLAQSQQHYQPRQSPSNAPAASQNAATSGSSNATPAPQ